MLKNIKYLVFVLMMMFCLTGFNHRVKAKEPLAKGNFFWHWHRKTCLNSKNVKKILQWKSKGIFFHMGLFDYYRDEPQFNGFVIQSDTFRRLRDLNLMQIHLVYTFSGTKKSAFIKYFHEETEKAICFILERIESDLNVVQGKGLNISGIQLDMETNVQFDKYKKLIDSVVRRYGEEYLISITPQVYWYKRKGFKRLIENVDFIVPMMYDYAIGKNVKSLMKVSDSTWIKSVLRKYKSVKKPFYAGIPTYSYCKIYNKRGKRTESWAKLSVEEVSENKDFKLIKAKRKKGQNTYVFRALRRTKLYNYQFDRGWTVKFNLITPEAVRNYVKAVNKVNPENLLGVAFFRYGYFKENLVLNEQEIDQVLGHSKTQGCRPKGEILINRKKYLQLAVGEEVKLNLVLMNEGDQSSYVARTANQFHFEVENGEIIKYDGGGFDSIKEKENKLIFSEEQLSKNEAVYSGLIKIEVTSLPLILKFSTKSMQLNRKVWFRSEKKVIELFSREEEIEPIIQVELKTEPETNEEKEEKTPNSIQNEADIKIKTGNKMQAEKGEDVKSIVP